MFHPGVLVWEAFWKVALITPWVASEASKVKGEELMSGRDAFRSTSGASPPHLSGRTRRVEGGPCVGMGQTKSDQKGKGFGVKSVYTPI